MWDGVPQVLFPCAFFFFPYDLEVSVEIIRLTIT